MLQQTQVARVLGKYPEFLTKYPTLRMLARARVSDVIRTWRGMGYNNRALRLHALSKIVVREFEGRLPGDLQILKTLPGIGRYTASAVACFAFGRRVPLVDTNISRVLRRLAFTPERLRRARSINDWLLAEEILPRTDFRDWNQALMDLGSTICTAARPQCDTCPLPSLCPNAHAVPHQRNRTTKNEPARDGIPNRIYRGRVVEALRNLGHGETIGAHRLARKIKTDFGEKDRNWFDLLLSSLEHDGLIRHHKRSRISLRD